jgi:hypothetical protein
MMTKSGGMLLLTLSLSEVGILFQETLTILLVPNGWADIDIFIMIVVAIKVKHIYKYFLNLSLHHSHEHQIFKATYVSKWESMAL